MADVDDDMDLRVSSESRLCQRLGTIHSSSRAGQKEKDYEM